MPKLLSLLAALALAGCALPDYPCEVHLRPEGFNAEQLNAVDAAVQGWTKVLGEGVVTLGPDGDTPIIFTAGGCHGRAGQTALNPDGSLRIDICKATNDYLTVRYLAAHEIGHSLGLTHTDTGVMQSPAPEDRRILPTVEDAAPIVEACGE